MYLACTGFPEPTGKLPLAGKSSQFPVMPAQELMSPVLIFHTIVNSEIDLKNVVGTNTLVLHYL